MQYTTLGRTGLTVSVAGLGCGGHSRLGLATGKTEAEAVALVRAALDLGVSLIDTAAPYRTEHIVGEAIEGRRDQVVIATKATVFRGNDPVRPADLIASLDNSLRLLRTDVIDVFQCHAVRPHMYDHVRDVLVPALRKEQQKGKFRFLGITETSEDPEHLMLARAIPDGIWDTAMVSFAMMNQHARTSVFPLTRAGGVGTLMMYAVRQIFSRPERLRTVLQDLAQSGQLPAELASLDDPLGFLVHPQGASSVTDAAYRYVRHEPGVDVVLFGTGDQAHLRANVESLLKPPLPAADRRRLNDLFGHLVGVGLDNPGAP